MRVRILAGAVAVVTTAILLIVGGSIADALHVPGNALTTTIFSGGVLASGPGIYRAVLGKFEG